MSYWDDAVKGAQEESGPGKPVIAKGRIALGYFTFIGGFSGEDRKKCIFIPKSGKDGRAKARTAAQKLCTDNGNDADRAKWCIITTIYQDEAMYANGEDVDSWGGDQLDPIPLWTVWDKQGNRNSEPSAGGLVWDTVNELKIAGGKDFYGLFNWVADPYKVSLGEAGKTKESTSNDGTVTMRYPTVCVVREVYPDRKTAAAAVGTPSDNGDSDADYDWATGWTTDDLQAVYDGFVASKDDYDSFVELVENEAGDEGVAWGVKLLSEFGDLSVEEIVKFTGMKRGKVRKALK